MVQAVEARADAGRVHPNGHVPAAAWVCLRARLDEDCGVAQPSGGTAGRAGEGALYLACRLDADVVLQARSAEALARLVIESVGAGEPEAGHRGGLPTYRLRRVENLVERRIGDAITVAEMASEARMSEAHFARQFKQSVGETPLEYVTRRRVEAAQRLLAETDLAVGDVGRRVGYSSASHFAEVFRRYVGITPRGYRARHAA